LDKKSEKKHGEKIEKRRTTPPFQGTTYLPEKPEI